MCMCVVGSSTAFIDGGCWMYDKFCSSWMICITNIIWQEESHYSPFHEGIIKISHSQKALLAYNPKTDIIWKFCEWKIFGDDHTAIRLKISVSMETFGDDRALD